MQVVKGTNYVMKKTNVKIRSGRFAGLIGQKYHRLLKAIPGIIHIEKLMAQSTLPVLSAKKASRGVILDLGCGTGMTTLALCEKVKNVVIIGIDSEPTMLKQYVANMKEHHLMLRAKNIQIQSLEVDILDYVIFQKESSIDLVVSGYTLHNLPREQRQQILNNVGRILCKSGRFINGDKIARDNDRLHERDITEQLEAFIKAYNHGDDISYGLEWIRHYIRDDQPDLKCTEAEVFQSLRQAGFAQVKIIGRRRMDAVVVADRSQ